MQKKSLSRTSGAPYLSSSFNNKHLVKCGDQVNVLNAHFQLITSLGLGLLCPTLQFPMRQTLWAGDKLGVQAGQFSTWTLSLIEPRCRLQTVVWHCPDERSMPSSLQRKLCQNPCGSGRKASLHREDQELIIVQENLHRVEAGPLSAHLARRGESSLSSHRFAYGSQMPWLQCDSRNLLIDSILFPLGEYLSFLIYDTYKRMRLCHAVGQIRSDQRGGSEQAVWPSLSYLSGECVIQQRE